MSSLYQKHFGLNAAPFQITPNIDYFFTGSRRGDMLAALLHVACHEDGIAAVVAEIGSGKTLLARLLIRRLPEQVDAVYLANPCFSRDEIIDAIARDLGLTGLPVALEGKLAVLREELLRRHAAGKRVLLVIDEAHAMPAESLEEIRLLSNLETDRHKLINILLFGQPELDALLAERRLRQLRDRIVQRFDLVPFSREDGAAYLDHRLRIAGWQGGKLFASAAETLLLRAAGGRARRINLLADKALLAAYADGVQQVTRRHVRIACAELGDDPAARRPAFFWQRRLSFGLALAVTLATGVWLGNANSPPAIPPAAATAPIETMTASKATTATTTTPATTSADTTLTPQAAPPDPAQLEAAARAHTAELLTDPRPQGYTVQIATLPAGEQPTHYFGLIGRHVDASLIYAHNGSGQAGPYVAVYVGRYATREGARMALQNLPAPLKANQPLIRTWARIRQETVL